MSSDKAYRIAAEHITWARKQGMTPEQVLLSVNLAAPDEDHVNWAYVRLWLAREYRKYVKPMSQEIGRKKRFKTVPKKATIPANHAIAQMRTLFVGRAA